VISFAFIQGFLPRRKNVWRSWQPLVLTFPLIFGLLNVIPVARLDEAVAHREESSVGTVTAYTPSDHNQCNYDFAVHGKLYSGRSSALTSTVTVGDKVKVYYDSSDPQTNNLREYAEAGRSTRGFAKMLIVLLLAILGFVACTRSFFRPGKPH
jgi:hypothetical protein